MKAFGNVIRLMLVLGMVLALMAGGCEKKKEPAAPAAQGDKTMSGTMKEAQKASQEAKEAAEEAAKQAKEEADSAAKEAGKALEGVGK
jgi:outer membrane murein-binding lipoprotein Lpp